MTKNILNFSQKLQLHAALEAALTMLDNGMCQYKDANQNDDYIAKQMLFPCTVPNVRSLRQEVFGDLARGGTAKKIDVDLQQRVTRLEQVFCRMLAVAANTREKDQVLKAFYEDMNEQYFVNIVSNATEVK